MLTVALAFFAMMPGQGSLPPLHVQGADLLDPSGKKVQLRGCNLGNWFVIEHWMLDQVQPEGSSYDQYTLENILQDRFGKAEKDRLMELYRSSWITERDFKIIKKFRFNVVRLPMNYRQFEDDSKPYKLRADAFKWTDRAIAMAKKNGMYVILDMHGAQGGQSNADHTGRSGQNKIWTSEEDQKRFVWLWGEIAKKYRDEPAVVAYDTMNEPYGGTKPQVRDIFDKLYPVVRKNDPEKLIWICARYDGFENLGIPKENGWHNVGIEDHYYPGMFGNGYPTLRTQARHLNHVKKDIAPIVAKLDSPFLIGEFNVVFKAAGGAETMRRTYDLYEGLGWTPTMWSYKVLSANGGIGEGSWGMVTNKKPFTKLNFTKATKAQIEDFFRSQATMPYEIYDELQKSLAPEHVDLAPLPEYAARTTAPQGELPGWVRADIGGARTGGLETKGDDLNLYGGGDDVWGGSDHCSFLYQEITGDFDLSVTLRDEEDLGSYCKAGLMVRASLNANDKALLMSSFPNGELQGAWRDAVGGDMQGTSTVEAGGFPLELKVSRRGSSFKTSFRKKGSTDWTLLKETEAPWLPATLLCGAIALSHDDSQLIKVGYSKLKLTLKEGQ